MTVRVTTLKGLGAGRYYVEQLPNYYLDANEPRGRWVGIAAHELAFSGELDDEEFLAVMDGLDPNRPDRHLGRAYGDESVRGFDVTCSAPKSVSVLFALGDERRHSRRILDHWQGRNLRPTTDHHRATEPARLDDTTSTPVPEHTDTADVGTPNAELRRQLRQLRTSRQRPSFGLEIDL